MSDLRVVIIHYHLQRGGVTRVIQNAVSSLADHGVDTLICSGEPKPDDLSLDAPVYVVPELGYSNNAPSTSPDELVHRIADACTHILGASPDVWHLHNHTLGKNASIPLLAGQLAQQCRPMLLQTHDFAEDGRPENYQLIRRHILNASSRPALYPVNTNILYAALNSRDQRLLTQAGLEHVTVLHNPVTATHTPQEPTTPLILYPTRAIRRKNLGEFLLWAAMCPDKGPYGVTLAPENDAERDIYQHWVSLAQALALPIQFELGEREPFPSLMGRATTLMTTSIAEGFGLAFLEGWLAGKPLAGRNLPDITADITAQGINLETLYDELSVPADWVDTKALKSTLSTALRQTYAAYQREASADDIEKAVSAACVGDRIRFDRLDETFQADIIRRCVDAPTRSRDIAPNTFRLPSSDVVSSNAKAVSENFSLPQYGIRLKRHYEALASAPSESPDTLDPVSVLAQFLRPERFTLLRS